MRTSDFNYDLPEAAIAQEALEPRDASRLLVIPELADFHFSDLPGLLHPGDLVVVNRTRVRAARLSAVRRDTGGVVELLLTRKMGSGTSWEALARPSRRLRPSIVLDVDGMVATITDGPHQGVVTLDLESEVDVEDAIAAIGTVPLPPYFRGNLPDAERYQTMFSTTVGSAAAPTAALHFTPAVVAALELAGVAVAAVELEVGLDTFRPITSEMLADHQIHTERFIVPPETAAAITACKERGRRVVAVGTTVVRTLESAGTSDGHIASGANTSSLFIKPGYRFAVVDALVTNFHAPATTLIVLLAAILGPSWRDVYHTALERGYRFLSFGDAMYIRDVKAAARD